MNSIKISYPQSGYFSSLITDYLNEDPKVSTLYNRFPKMENFQGQIAEKKANYTLDSRMVLVEALERQNQKISLSEATQNNIQLLKNQNTFTITTGHQLSLFTGPLFFLYKIISIIKLAEQLKITHPECDFVPVFWMATEDHDFEEISFFHTKNKKIQWHQDQKGAVGRLSTNGLKEVSEQLTESLGQGKNAADLKMLFDKSYLEHSNLADATRFLVNELFGDKGLVIIDGDDKQLKKQFVPILKKELTQQIAYQSIHKTLETFPYKVQVTPREINLFYLDENLRERIVFEDNVYRVLNTDLQFSEQEISALAENSPEKFSPNVVLRPLYQECVLPNLAYIGGGGEIAYWLELQSLFESQKITFPMLIIRDSVVLISEKQIQKSTKLQLTWQDLFLKQADLITQKTHQFSEFPIDLSSYKENIKKQFEQLHALVSQTDASFLGAVSAQEKKQLSGFYVLEKRLLKAQKRKYNDQLKRIIELQNELFPNQSLQERLWNFSDFYKEYGADFLDKLYDQLDVLSIDFKMVRL